MNNYVCIDIDGTVLDLLSAMAEVMAKDGIVFIPEKVTRYNFDGDFGCSKEDCFRYLNKEEVFLAELNYPICSLKETADILRSEDITPFVYTLVDYDNLAKIREKYIKLEGVEEYKIFKGKKPVYLDASALFEDCLENISDWLNSGYSGKVYLIDAPYNKEEHNKDFPYFDCVTRVGSAKEAAEKFVAYLNELPYER